MINEKKNTSNILFYISFWLLLFVAFFSRVYIIEDFCRYIKFISLMISIFAFAMQSKIYSTKSFISLLFIGIVLSYSAYKSKNTDLLCTFLLIFSAKNINFDAFIKFVFRWSVFFLTTVLFLHFFGFTNDYIDIRINGVYRNSMGFAHPNTFGYILMMIAIEYFYIKKDKLKIKTSFYLIPYIIVINHFSNSRAAILVLILLFLFIIYKNIIGEKILYNKFIRFFVENSFVIIFLVISICLYLYINNNEIGLLLNNLLSKRLYWLEFYISNYDINFFGQYLEIIPIKLASTLNVSYTALDNTYYYILLNFGLVVFILFSVLYRKLFKSLYNKNSSIEIILLFLINIYGIFERTTILVNMNCFLIMFSNIIYSNVKGKE